MTTVLIDDLDKRVVADAGAEDSQRRATSCRGFRGLNIGRRVRLWQRQDHVSARPHGGARWTRAVLLAAAVLAAAATAPAQEYDPPITTLVTNMQQPSGSDILVSLSKGQDGLYQGFTTGPNPSGYELTSILLYVRDTHESRYMTILAGLYHGDTKIADLTRGQLNDFAHNEWLAPPDTYLQPDTHYHFVLDCVSGCENDNKTRFGATHSSDDDSGGEEGWTVEDLVGFRKSGDEWCSDPNKILRIRVKGRPSPYRAYKTEIASVPRNGDTYSYGENIDIALTFISSVYVPEEGSEIGIRVGEAVDGPTYRAAEYLSGSLTNRLVYRYQVQMGDSDANGISVAEGGPDSGFVGSVPTIVASFGLLPVDRYFSGVADSPNHKVDGSLQVTDVEITSRPAHGNGYRLGEDIDVTLTFSAEAFVGSDDSVIDIRVGDDSSNHRAARYESGTGTNQLVYRYQVQFSDFDATGVSVDSGGAHSGFGGPLPTTSPELGSLPVSRDYSGVDEDSGHKVARSADASFDVDAFTVSEGGAAATVTVELDPDPDRSVTIPIIAAVGDGATIDDYTLSTTSLTFARGETSQSFTVTAVDDSEDDDGESLELSFGTLPAGIRAGSQAAATVTIADDDGAATGQTVTISAGRDAYIAVLDDVVFNLTLAEASDQAIVVNVKLTQEQSFLNTDDLTQSVEFPADATAAELRIYASQQNERVIQSGTLTATVIEGAGYHIGAPAAASVRMAVGNPALIARLGQPLYSFDEGATGAAASVEIVMETQRGFPALNRSHEVTVSTESATAVADVDYVSVSETVTFTPEEFSSADGRWVAHKSIEVLLIDDAEDELEELFMVTLARDSSLSDQVQVRNSNRTECDGPCQSRIAIVDNDEVGVAFLDGDGNPLTDFRLEVREGEQVTYLLKLDRQPVEWVVLSWESGDGDSDLVALGEQSWRFSPEEDATSSDVHHWEEAFPVTVEALQDNDTSSGERRFHHYLSIDGPGHEHVELPDVVIVEIDNEVADTPPPDETSQVLSIADARATEEADATLEFAVMLSRAALEAVTVDYATVDGTAQAGQDYTAADGTLTFAAGETQKTVSVAVLDDAHDEGEETLTLTLRNASGVDIADDVATGTIENDDPLQQAWLARFGRTTAQRVLDGVQARLTAPHEAGMQAIVAGHDLSGAGEVAAQDRFEEQSEWVRGEVTEVQSGSQLPTMRDLVTRSAFTLSSETVGGLGTLWGRGAYSGFGGSANGLSLDGGMTTGMFGADYAIGRWVVGLPLSHSRGDGSWHSADRGTGRMASSLTGLYPYVGYELAERLSLWGTAGYGQGDLALMMQGGESHHTAMGLTMAAVGARGDLVRQAGGLSLVIESDALLVRTTSAAAADPSGLLAAAVADVSRLRLGLEGSLDLALGGGLLTPTVELGLRHDGGDAETGFGVEIGGGTVFADATRGLLAQVMVRGLVVHEAADFRDWRVSGSLRFDPTPSSELGPAVALTPSWGGSSSGGVAVLLGRETLAGLAANDAPASVGRLDAEAAYGLAVFGGRATGTPYLRMGQSEAFREVRMGCRLELLRWEGLEMGVEGTQRESTVDNMAPDREVMLHLALSAP